MLRGVVIYLANNWQPLFKTVSASPMMIGQRFAVQPGVLSSAVQDM